MEEQNPQSSIGSAHAQNPAPAAIPTPPTIPESPKKSLGKKWILIFAILVFILSVCGYFILSQQKSQKADSVSTLPRFDQKICAQKSYYMGWGNKTAERLELYDVQIDQCDGYRCVANNNVSPACYNENECKSQCHGQCLNVPETKKVCQQLETQQPSPTPDKTANWKTYTNSQYSYSFKYPATWYDQFSIDAPCKTCGGAPRGFSVVVVPNTQNISATKLAEMQVTEANKGLTTPTAKIIQTPPYFTGLDAALADGFPGAGNPGLKVYITKGSSIFELGFENVDDTTANTLLSTFKFTESTITSTPAPSLMTCPAAPVCPEGKNLMHGDPGPDSVSKCPAYFCN